MSISQAMKVIDGGKLVIPAQFRRELGISVGDTVVIELDDGVMHVRSLAAAVRQAQAIVREFVPENTRLVDQLIEERRAQSVDE